jgi:hypothetical protein
MVFFDPTEIDHEKTAVALHGFPRKDRLLRSIDNPFRLVHRVGLFQIDDYLLHSAANEDTVEFFHGWGVQFLVPKVGRNKKKIAGATCPSKPQGSNRHVLKSNPFRLTTGGCGRVASSQECKISTAESKV